MLHYGGCRNAQDRRELAGRIGIVNEDGSHSIERLYNLANRLGVTGRNSPMSESPVLAQGEGRNDFTPEFDSYLRQEYGRRRLDSVAFHHGYSEPAALYRARQLGLRHACPYWDLDKVAGWLGFKESELTARVPLYPLPDRRGRRALTLVASTDLLTLLDSELAGADPFFLLELREIRELLAGGELLGPTWLSHEGLCLNPYAMGFGLFMGEEDEKSLVLDLTVEDLAELGAERWDAETPLSVLA